jgi:hypothetical protein
LYGICGIGASISLFLTFNHQKYRGFIIVIVCLAAWLGLQYLGYTEFGVAGRAFVGGYFRSVLSAQFALDAFEQEVRNDLTLQECWEVLCRACPSFGFSGIRFHLNDEIREWGNYSGWQARIDFPGHGFISLWRESGAKSRDAAAVLFIESVSRVFDQKLSQFAVVRQG